MYAELACGFCESNLHLDTEWEESCWLMVYRFADAHTQCGSFTDRTELPSRAVTVEDSEDGSSSGD